MIPAINIMRKSGLVFIFLLILVCCNQNEQIQSDLAIETICSLNDSEQPISLPLSFDFVNDSTIVVADNNKVYLFSTSGEMLSEIGHSGNAAFEYNCPSYVKSHNDSIYVWSSMSLQFITFSLKGEPGTIYQYDSAICDFEPSDELICIYSAGRRNKGIIDVLDKKSRDITSLGQPSEEHKVLCQNASTAPLALDAGKVLYASKDALTIYSFDITSKKESIETQYESDSFSVIPISNDASSMDRRSRSQYIKDNPITLGILPSTNGTYSMLALEGCTQVINNEIHNESRILTIYQTKNGEALETHYPIIPFGHWHLFRFHEGKLFFINNVMEGNDEEFVLQSISIE